MIWCPHHPTAKLVRTDLPNGKSNLRCPYCTQELRSIVGPATETVRLTVQSGRERPNLPDPFHQEPGARLQVDYKASGMVVKSEVFACAAYESDGETIHRWRQINR